MRLSEQSPPPPFHVQFYEDEQEDGEAPEGGAAVAEQGQRDAYYGNKAHCHSNVYEYVHEEAAGYAVAVDAGKGVFLPFAEDDEPYDQEQVYPHYKYRTQKTPFFANGAEDEVCALLRYKVKFGLGAGKEPFAGKAAGTNCNFGLVHVVACPHKVSKL